MSKECFKCHKNKPLAQFYKHAQMGDGYLNKCKECAKKDTIKNRENNLEYYKEYDRKRGSLPHRRKARKIYSKKAYKNPVKRAKAQRAREVWLVEHSDKRACHIMVGNAIKRGDLKRLPCEICGRKKRIHAHHDDYTKPLSVTWLCPIHHGERHAQINEQKRNGLILK